MSRRQTRPTVTLPCVHPHAAGLDLSQSEIWAAVPADRSPTPIRTFGTFTPDVLALADWLTACRIDTVAMEATSVFWIPVYEMLEAKGFEIFVVNARHIKNVPGRKSDVQDCQWIQYLHSVGLLSRSFRPEAQMAALRAYLRHRAALLESRVAHIQHMQKALLQMNVQLTQVLSDITSMDGVVEEDAVVEEIGAAEHGDDPRPDVDQDPERHEPLENGIRREAARRAEAEHQREQDEPGGEDHSRLEPASGAEVAVKLGVEREQENYGSNCLVKTRRIGWSFIDRSARRAVDP